jgi:hypothetical protein
MKQKKIRKTVKKFLSPTPYEYGSVCWEVVCDPKDEYDLLEASLRIADCNETITIGFSSLEKKHLNYRIKKLDTLIKSLQDMRDLMTSESVQELLKQKIEKKNDRKRSARRAKLVSQIDED